MKSGFSSVHGLMNGHGWIITRAVIQSRASTVQVRMKKVCYQKALPLNGKHPSQVKDLQTGKTVAQVFDKTISFIRYLLSWYFIQTTQCLGLPHTSHSGYL